MAVKKLKASTLIETIVAMVILCLVFYSITLVLASFTDNDGRLSKIKAVCMADSVYYATRRDQLYLDDETESNGLTVQKQCTLLSGSDNTVELVVNIKKKDRLIYSRKNIIFK